MFAIKYLFYSTIYVKITAIVSLFLLTLVITMGLTKLKRIRYINKYIKEFETTFWSGISLDQYYETNKNELNHPLGMVFKAVFEEWMASANLRSLLSAKNDIKERMLNVAHVQKVQIMQTCERYLDLLKTFIHATPFIGLLGTIFGIIDVFYNVDIENGLTITSASAGIGGSMVCLVLSIIIVLLSMSLYWFVDMKIQGISDKVDAFIVDLLNILCRGLDGTAVNGGGFVEQPMPQQQFFKQEQPPVNDVKDVQPAEPVKKPKPVVDDDI